MSFLLPRRFLFKFSLLIGIATISAMGIMLMSTSLFINLAGSDPEASRASSMLAHWIILLTFLLSGEIIYILGVVAAYKKSPLFAKVTGILLIIHFIYWAVLTGISFVDDSGLNRYVCIDNRCADRLFMKNGNWRSADILCQDPSTLRWRLGGNILEEIEHVYDSPLIRNMTDLPRSINFESLYYDQKFGAAPLTGNRKLPLFKVLRLKGKHNTANDSRYVIQMRRKGKNDTMTKVGKRDRKSQKHNGTHHSYIASELSKGNVTTWVNTPIGYVGCSSSAHIALSAICTILILFLWYIYPLLIIFSFVYELNIQQILD